MRRSGGALQGSVRAGSALHYTWELGARACRWHRDAPHEKGISAAGAHSLFATHGGGTRYHMAWDLGVRIPVLGKTLERKAEPAILEGAARRAAFARRWLAEGKIGG